MTEDVYVILLRRFTNAPDQYLFTGTDLNKLLAAHRKAFIVAYKRAGIHYGLNSEEALIFNVARRTAENRILAAGHFLRSVGDIQGDSPEAMAKHYARTTRESRRAAVEATRTGGWILTVDSIESVESIERKKTKKASSGE